MGVVCSKVWDSLCLISLIFLKYHMKMKYFGLTETKSLHFHRIFKNGGRGGGLGGFKSDPP